MHTPNRKKQVEEALAQIAESKPEDGPREVIVSDQGAAPLVGSRPLLAVCANCKYWRRGGSFQHVWSASAKPGGERFTVGPITRDLDEVVDLRTNPEAKFGICLHPLISCCGRNGWLGWEDSADPRGLKVDAYDERGNLSTGQDFGCRHFSSANIAVNQPGGQS